MKRGNRNARVLCIDLENCPNQILELPQVIHSFRKIIICYANKAPKVPLHYLTLFASSVQNKKLEVLPIPSKGKNASDFGLTFHAGRVLAEMPANTELVIVSNDGDLDHLVALVKDTGHQARRIPANELLAVSKESSAETPTDSESDSEAEKALAETVEEYRTAWLIKANGRPAKRATLLKTIRSFLPKKSTVKAQSVLDELVRAGDLSIDKHGRVQYHDDTRPFPVEDDEETDVPF